MRALVDYVTLIDDDDLVRILNRLETVGDHDRCAPACELLYRLFYDSLRASVERRSRLVEEENRRVFQERPRDRDPLPLSAGEL